MKATADVASFKPSAWSHLEIVLSYGVENQSASGKRFLDVQSHIRLAICKCPREFTLDRLQLCFLTQDKS